MERTPLCKWKERTGYNIRYAKTIWGGTVPVGICGEEFITLSNSMVKELKEHLGNFNFLEECKKRGSMEGYEKLV